MNATKEQVAQLHQAYLRDLAPAQARLKAKMVNPDDPDLDGTVDSLTAASRWFLAHIADPPFAEQAVLPSWWDPAYPAAATPFTTAQLALIDEMQAYVGGVMTTARPDATWVIHTGHKQDSRNGQTMLQLDKGRPFPVRDITYSFALSVVKNQVVRDEELPELITTALANWPRRMPHPAT